MTFLTLKMISIGFDNVAIEPGVLKNQCFDAEFRSLAHLELDFWQKLPKFANLTLKSDLLTFRMTFDVVKNVTIKLGDPQNPQIDPGIVSLVLLELISTQNRDFAIASASRG